MNNNKNAASVLDMVLAVSVMLLLLDVYCYCYAAFEQWGLVGAVPRRIMVNIYATGLFNTVYKAKLLSLLFLILALTGGLGRKSIDATYRSCLGLMAAGLLLYFGSSAVLAGWSGNGDVRVVAGWYILISITGYVVVLIGGARCARVLPSPFRKNDPFGKQQGGFPQERRRMDTVFGINLPARYTEKKKEKDSWVNIVNARRGILIIGSPGSGKSRYIIEPIIRQLMEKGFAMFIYDLKYDNLTRQAYHLFQKHRAAYPEGTRFYSINFTDVSRSHRCNLLDPVSLVEMSDAIGASKTLMLSLNRTWAHQQGEFFVESPINFLAALIWWLKKYQGGRYCTLPHAIELAQVRYDQLFSVLATEPEVSVLVNPFREAFRNGTLKMLDGQISGAKIPLGRLASPNVYYILTGNDFTLDINDPAAPKIFCLGGDPARQESLAPILSLYIDRMNRLVNHPGKYPCALVCDEFATVRAYSMNATIATARSNHIVPVLSIQDISQLRTRYSRDEADTIMDITGNIFCGQVGGETARWVSERFPKVQREKMSVSTNSNDTSVSHSLQWEPVVTPATIATLSSGEFVGVVADDPDKPIELKAFHAKLRREEDMPYGNEPLPVVMDGDVPATVQQAFQQVREEVEALVRSELERMMADDGLRGLILPSRTGGDPDGL